MGCLFMKQFGLLAVVLTAFPALSSDSWLQWGGPNGDFTVSEQKLAESWPESGPPVIWKRELGDGYAGVLVENGILYTAFHDGDEDVATALNAKDGTTIWESRAKTAPIENQSDRFGHGPNATPLIHGDYLYTHSFDGLLQCLNKKDGKVVWSHNLVEQFDGQVHRFGSASAPITYRDRLIVLVGGSKYGAVGFNLSNGKMTWHSEPMGVNYAAPVVIQVQGQDQLVFMSTKEVVGVALDSGKVQWRHPHENQYNTHCAGPWWEDDGLLFVSTQTGGGSKTLRLTREGSQTKVEEVLNTNRFNIFHNNAIRVGKTVYGSNGDILTAMNIESGELLWRERGYTKANLLLAGDHLVILDEEGKLTLAEASPQSLRVLASHQLLSKPAWTTPTLVDGKLYLRDRSVLMALNLSPQ